MPDSSVNIEDILKLYDDNGNWIQKDKSENMDWEALLEELEENYSNVDLPDDCPSVEEILAKYDDNGNTLKEVANGNANEEGNTNQKRRKRRRKRRKKRANVEILHSNTRGYSSKQEVWEDILKKEQPDIVTINETSLMGKRTIKQKNYFSYCKNRDRNMESRGRF